MCFLVLFDHEVHALDLRHLLVDVITFFLFHIFTVYYLFTFLRSCLYKYILVSGTSEFDLINRSKYTTYILYMKILNAKIMLKFLEKFFYSNNYTIFTLY